MDMGGQEERAVGVVMGVIEGFVSFLMTIEVTDILDMAIIAYLVYRLLSFLSNCCWHHNMGTAQQSPVSWNHNIHI